MDAMITIGWLFWLLVSVALVFGFVGTEGLTDFFPEGRRWWMPYAQYASLTFFAAAVLMNPFIEWHLK